MKYMLLIHQGTTPLPGTEAWDGLSKEEQGAVYGAYQADQRNAGGRVRGADADRPRPRPRCGCRTARR